MIIFICIYLLIGIGFQIMGQLLDKKVLDASADVVDMVLFEEESDHEDNAKIVDDLLSKKRWILVNVIAWPINVLVTAVVIIKVHFLTK